MFCSYLIGHLKNIANKHNVLPFKALPSNATRISFVSIPLVSTVFHAFEKKMYDSKVTVSFFLFKMNTINNPTNKEYIFIHMF